MAIHTFDIRKYLTQSAPGRIEIFYGDFTIPICIRPSSIDLIQTFDHGRNQVFDFFQFRRRLIFCNAHCLFQSLRIVRFIFMFCLFHGKSNLLFSSRNIKNHAIFF